MAACHGHDGNDDCPHCRTTKQASGSFLENEKNYTDGRNISETGV